MACSTQIRFAQPEAGSCVTQELVDYLNAKTVITTDCGASNAKGIYFGPNPPQDQTIVWYRTTAAGQPMYMLVAVNGVWRRVSATPIGLLCFYDGPISGVFDPLTGKGIAGGEWDGWTIRYSDANKFIVLAESYTAGQWVSSVTGSPLHTGGDATVTSNASNTYRPSVPAVIVGHCNADGNDNVTPWEGVLYGTVGTQGQSTLLNADAGNTSPTAVTNVPPFVAHVLVEYTGH